MPIYLDHNATTALDERVLEAMMPYLREGFGNPSSIHAAGRAARTAVDTAREQVAALVGAHPSQVVFTSGGTEANNTALKGYCFARSPGRIAVSAAEHASVLTPARALRRHGWEVTTLGVDRSGRLPVSELGRAVGEGTALVSAMWANNETGVLNDIPALAAVARERGAVLHTDAVQAAGKVAVDFAASGAHLMSLSAHKIGGPKGVGALLADKAVALEPLLHGGGQERDRRGGTENVAVIVGFGRAAELARSELAERRQRVAALRDRLEAQLPDRLPDVVLFGSEAPRLPNTVFLAVPGIDGETLILALDRRGIFVSAGSACGSGHSEPSPVLKAMGVAPELANCAVRISFGAGNSESDVDALVGALADETALLRKMASAQWA